MNLLKRVWTAAGFADVREELHRALHARLGACPGDAMLAGICSMAAVEHGLHEASPWERRWPARTLREDVLALLAANPIDPERPWESFWYLRGICCNNVGNHDGSAPGAIGIFETVAEREIINGAETTRVHRRAAFATLADGCAAYVWRLAERWPRSFETLGGSPYGLALSLKHEPTASGGAKSYYTEDEAKYARLLIAMRRQYDAIFSYERVADLCGWP